MTSEGMDKLFQMQDLSMISISSRRSGDSLILETTESGSILPTTKTIKEGLTRLTKMIVDFDLKNPSGVERVTQLNNLYRELAEMDTAIGM
jgi:hypothetical protein